MFKKIAPSLLAILTLAACADNSPNVIMETEMGNIEIEVYPKKAPLSAENFLIYVDEGLYDGEGFYRVVRPDNDPRDMGMSLIQGGRLDANPLTADVPHERTSDIGMSNTPGIVSLARNEPGSGNAAFFFINIGDNSFLDYGGERNPDGEGYATFGRVVDGMDVVTQIQALEATGESDVDVTNGQILADPVKIIRAYRK